MDRGEILLRVIESFATLGLFATFLLPTYLINRDYSHFPKVQQGYVAPSKLEIDVRDLDGNGELETTMKYNDKQYLLREVNGKPFVTEY